MKITLSLAGLDSPAAIHDYLQQALAFPDYYGRNLDALYDLLSTWPRPTVFTLRLPQSPADPVRDYLPRLCRVFRDAAQENPRVQVKIR